MNKAESFEVMEEMVRELGAKKMLGALHSYFSGKDILEALERIDADYDLGCFEEPESEIEEYMEYELQDDGTLVGGVSFAGEKVESFIKEFDWITTLDELDEALEECGILPIER